MDALLDSPRSNHVCSDIQDLQSQLQSLLAAKSSDTRAEHASLTFELRYHTVFHLTADSEDGATAGADPAHSSHHQPPVPRTVNASETIQNQPADDPVLQKAVAKHIMTSLGAVDGSLWVVRQVARGAQGWTFTYICKDSLQAWNRAQAKNTERPVIGDYSGAGGLDPINISRPAFDCRGTLTIAFSKASRAVVVKYEHTPLHKTVVQLLDALAPSLPSPPVNNGNTSSQRTPKAKRPPPAEGEESNRKRRKKKGKAPEAPMMAETPVNNEKVTQGGDESQKGGSQSGAPAVVLFNVPPAEAERRRQTAIELLSGKGIDPATLSAEQFNIFANQAPNLQSASLEMLAKYGAERLRIVHPDDNKGPAASSSSTPTQEHSANTTPATGPAASSNPGATETPSKKSRSKKKAARTATEVSIGDGAVVSLEQSGEIGTTESALQPKGRKTRGTCNTCKQRKVKCTKEHPACSVCREAELQCVYLPPRPRRRSEKHPEVVGREDSDVPGEVEQFQAETEPPDQEPAPAPTPASIAEPVPVHHPPAPDLDSEEFIPDPNILSGPVEHQPTVTQPAVIDHYQTHNTGLTFPPATSTQPQSDATRANLNYQHSTEHEKYTSQLNYSQPTVSVAESHHRKTVSASSRRSLPRGQTNQSPVLPSAMPTQPPSWNDSPSTSHKTTVSPTISAQRPRPRKSGVESSQQSYNGVNQAIELSQAAVQASSQPSQPTNSPYQTASRTKSRQGHRSQTSTPVANTTRPPPQASQASRVPQASSSKPQPTTNAAYSTTSASSSIPDYDPYSRYSSNADQYTASSADHGPSRIPYEPGSYQTNPTTTASTPYTSAPAYDYTRTTSSPNPLSQALSTNSGYTATSNSTANQWPTSQARSGQSHRSNQYSMPSVTPTTAHSYGARSTDTRASNQNASYNQSPSQAYPAYSSQTQGAGQQSQQNWYGFNSSNTNNQTNYTSSRNSGYGGASTSDQASSYSGHRPNVGYSNHAYGGSDEQSLYDLLRASGNN